MNVSGENAPFPTWRWHPRIHTRIWGLLKQWCLIYSEGEGGFKLPQEYLNFFMSLLPSEYRGDLYEVREEDFLRHGSININIGGAAENERNIYNRAEYLFKNLGEIQKDLEERREVIGGPRAITWVDLRTALDIYRKDSIIKMNYLKDGNFTNEQLNEKYDLGYSWTDDIPRPSETVEPRIIHIEVLYNMNVEQLWFLDDEAIYEKHSFITDPVPQWCELIQHFTQRELPSREDTVVNNSSESDSESDFDDDISVTSDESDVEVLNEEFNENDTVPTREQKIKQNLREAMASIDEHFSGLIVDGTVKEHVYVNLVNKLKEAYDNV